MKLLTLWILVFNLSPEILGCEPNYEFEGFGVNLGSIDSFLESESPISTIQLVLDQVYDDLGIRFFRTHYEKDFSPSVGVYEIPSTSDYHKTWNQVHSQLSTYSNISLMVSISSPPQHMKNEYTQKLLPDNEAAYLDFILAINQQMEDRFDLTVERVSPINEPLTGIPLSTLKNNTFMNPKQLCGMVKDFNNSVVSLCPEKSFYWTSIYYANFLNGTEGRKTCIDSCDIIATHGYSWFIDLLPILPPNNNNFKLYYDHKQYERRTTKPIWQTEVCSKLNTFLTSEIQEALDFSVNVGNFVGFMCVQRYYYYNMYTSSPSGESLMWGLPSEGSPGESLRFPKKYFAFKHFTTASPVWPVNITVCDPSTFFGTFCTQFGTSRAVFTNDLEERVKLTWHGVANCKFGSVVCTTEDEDWSSSGTIEDTEDGDFQIHVLPPKSVCSCEIEPPKEPEDRPSTSHRFSATTSLSLTLLSISTILLNQLIQ